MNTTSWLPPAGKNLFQEIKEKCTEEEARGRTLIRLSIGQPQGPAPLLARQAAAEAAMSDNGSMHEYQDNGSPGIPNFAQRFIHAHLKSFTSETQRFGYMPTPGSKSMLGLIPLACGASRDRTVIVATTTKPGYPTPADWAKYLGNSVQHSHLILSPENNFLFGVDDLEKVFLGDEEVGCPKLVMMNYLHNPSGQVMPEPWLIKLCEFCQRHRIRLFNDAAYARLVFSRECMTLADVAHHFPDLEWAEAFSASKLGNLTGWRIGAMVGSPGFINDIKTIKGNTDSGFVAPMAVGALALLEHGKEIDEVVKTYQARIELLVNTLMECGMKPVVRPGGGFFTLWDAPKMAFGQEMKDAKEFNFAMIEKPETGIVGVHFDPYIRYAVVGPVETQIGEIRKAFELAQVGY